MVKTIVKLTLLAVLASLFVVGHAQTVKAFVGCTYSNGQCVSHGCASGCLENTPGHCVCVD